MPARPITVMGIRMRLNRVILDIGGERRGAYVRHGASDMRVLQQMLVDRDYDLSRLRRFADLLAFIGRGRETGRRPLIVDAGANIGMSSIYFSYQVSDALIVSIEPEPTNYQLLVKNTEGLPVLPLPCALGSRNDRVRVKDVGEGEWGFRTETFSGSEDEPFVTSVTMPEIFAAMERDFFPFIVKIDVEGAEKDIFSGDNEWIERTPLIIIELHDWLLPGEGTSAPFLRAVSNLERDFVHIGENIFSISTNPQLFPANLQSSANK